MTRLLAIAVLAAFATSMAVRADVIPPKPEEERIILWEGGCFYPTCTEYEIELGRDGRYVLRALKNAKAADESTGTLAADAWEKAEAALNKARFYDWPDQLNAESTADTRKAPCIAHLPGVKFTRRITDTLAKTTIWDSGCPHEAAATLRDELRAIFQYETLIKPAK